MYNALRVTSQFSRIIVKITKENCQRRRAKRLSALAGEIWALQKDELDGQCECRLEQSVRYKFLLK